MLGFNALLNIGPVSNQTCNEVLVITKCLYTAGICRESMVRSADHRLSTQRPAEQSEGKDPSICVTEHSRHVAPD
jgi:hypothetical protein